MMRKSEYYLSLARVVPGEFSADSVVVQDAFFEYERRCFKTNVRVFVLLVRKLLHVFFTRNSGFPFTLEDLDFLLAGI